MRGRTVTVKLRTPDFKTATRQLSPPELPASARGPGDDRRRRCSTSSTFRADARYRLVGVGVSNFLDEEDEETEETEPSLFGAMSSDERWTSTACRRIVHVQRSSLHPYRRSYNARRMNQTNPSLSRNTASARSARRSRACSSPSRGSSSSAPSTSTRTRSARTSAR